MRPIDDLLGAELAERVLDAPAQSQRDVALAVATAALRATQLQDPILEEICEDLLHERYGRGMRSAAEAIEGDLDERAWRVDEEAAESGSAAYHSAFRLARAAGAVKSCLDGEPRAAVNEAIYEAAHAVDRDDRLPQLVAAVLDLLWPGGNHWAACDLARLFWPRFIVVESYILLAEHYTTENLASWRERHPSNPAAIEDVINHVHLEDVANDRAEDAAVTRVGEQLVTAWRRTLDAQGITARVEFSGTILTAFGNH